MKNMSVIVFIFFTSLTVHASPLSSFLDGKKQVTRNLAIAERVLNAQINKLERLIKERKNKGRKLNATDAGELLTALGRVRTAAFSIEYRLESIKREYREEALRSPAHDRFSSITALFGLESDIQGLIDELSDGLGIESILGKLKQNYFTIIDTTGNLILSLGDTAQLTPPQKNQLAQIRALHKSLLRIFERSSNKLLKAKDEAAGPRTVAFVRGTSMAHVADEGPSDLSAIEALKVEKRIVQELRANIEALQKTKIATLEETGLFVQGRGKCDGSIAKIR